MEAGRHHADNPITGAVQVDGAIDDRRIAAEAPFPQSMAEQNDVAGFLLEVVGNESAAQQRRRLEDRQEFGRHVEGIDLLGPTATGDRDSPGLRGGDGGEAVLLIAPIEIGGRSGGIGTAAPQAGFLNEDQPVGLGVRQWTQQDVVHHAEHGRIGANANGKRGNGDDGESRRFEQRSDAITQVGKQWEIPRALDYAARRRLGTGYDWPAAAMARANR